MSKSHDSIQQVGSSITTTINEGAISTSGNMSLTSGGTLAVVGDGYTSVVANHGAVVVVADGGDISLVASNAGDDVVLSTSSTGEVSVRSSLKQYGTNGTITINNGSISGTGTMTMTASNGLATVSGLTGVSITSGTGDVTLSGNNIFLSGELDTASGGMTIKANNGSSDVTITAPIAVGRSSSQPGLTATGGSTDGYGIVSTGSGTGPGILARSGSSGGYGAILESIGAPAVRTALRLVPQFADASSSEIGDVYIRDPSGLMSNRTAGPYWGNHVTKVKAITSSQTITVPSDSFAEGIYHVVAANTLRAGSTIRVFAAGTATDTVGLPSIRMTFDGDFDTVSTAQLTNSTNRFMIDCRITITSTTTYNLSASYDSLSLTTYTRRFSENAGTTFTNTHGIDIGLYVTAAEGGAVISVRQFIVDITD